MKKTKPRLFISHAVKDKPVVDAFFDLLQTGINIDPNETFCSSLEGMGIPSGVNFVDHIKEMIQDPELILLMLSPNYMGSTFCLCELGAGWAMSHNVIPILIPPLDYSALDAVLTGINAFKIDSETKLTEFREHTVDLLKLKAPSAARWEVKRKAFLDNLPDILSGIEPPKTVSTKEHQKLQVRYDGALEDMQKSDEEIASLKKLVEELKECKDREEVAIVAKNNSSEWDVFEDLCDNARAGLVALPNVVGKAIYHWMNGKDYVPDKWSGEWDSIREAEKNDYLELSDQDIGLNRDDPSVSDTLDLLDEVQKFLDADAIDNELSTEFVEQYLERYKHRPVFSSQKVWEEHFGL